MSGKGSRETALTPYVNNWLGIKGVTPAPRGHRYRARIVIDGKARHLGYFDNIIDAELAYMRAQHERQYAR